MGASEDTSVSIDAATASNKALKDCVAADPGCIENVGTKKVTVIERGRWYHFDALSSL